MNYRYGSVIRLKDGVRPQMSLDIETFFNLADEDTGDCDGGRDNKVKTYWGLPETAFETDDMGFVYLKSEYAKRLWWGVDDVIRIHDDFSGQEYDRLNINVVFDPEGDVNCGAFCSFVDEWDVEGIATLKRERKEKRKRSESERERK